MMQFWSRTLRGGTLFLLSLLVACQPNLSSLPDGAQLSCNGSADCPPNYTCSASSHLCVPSDSDHLTQPALMPPPTVEPALGNQSTPFKFTVSSTKPLKEAPDIELELDTLTKVKDCTSVTPSQYVCTYQPTGMEGGGTGGTFAYDVTLTDTFGNVVQSKAVGTFQMDFVAPGLASPLVTPRNAGQGATLHVSFTPTEPLKTGVDVMVTASRPLGGQTQFKAVNDQNTSNYHVDYPLRNQDGVPVDADGDVSFSVSLTDKAGNEAKDLVIGTATIDQMAPGIDKQSVKTDSLRYSDQPGHNLVTLQFNVVKPVDGSGQLTATIGGQLMKCGSFQDQPPNYTCTYPVTGQETPGTQSIIVQTHDEANNADSAWATVTFDFTRLMLTATPPSSPVKAGDSPVVSVTLNKLLQDAPQLTVQQNGQPSQLLGLPTVAGAGTAWKYTFPPVVAQGGTFDVLVTATDDVGYSAPAQTQLLVDGLKPAIGNIRLLDANKADATRFSAVPGHNQIQLTFNVTKSLDHMGVSPTVTLGALCPSATDPSAQPVPCVFQCGAYQPVFPSYTCTYQVTGQELASDGSAISEAVLPVSIQGTDEAGNPAIASTTLTLDFLPPSITSPRVSAAKVGVGQVESILFSTSEAVQPTPSLTTSGAGSLLFTPVAGTTYAFQDTILATDASGHYTTQIHLVDLAGNQAVVDGPAFDVDTNVPTLSNVTLNAQRFSTVAGHDQIQLTLDVNKSLDAAPGSLAVTLGGKCPMAANQQCAFACSAYDSTTQLYTCTYQVTGLELTADGTPISSLNEASLPVLIDASDDAGNEVYGNAVVTLDFTAPALVSQDASPASAGVGQRESLGLSASEPLQGTPSIVVTGASQTLPFQPVAGTTYSFAYVIQSTDTSGLYSSLVTMTDVVGNTGVVTGPSFNIDSVVPKISNVSTDAATYSEVPGHNVVTLSFDVKKAVDLTGAVTLGGKPMTCNTSQAPHYTCTYAVSTTTSTAGPQTILIKTADTAGNSDSAIATVVFDFTPLTLTATMAPNPSKANDVPVLSITTSKPLTQAPNVSIAPSGTVFGSLGGGGAAAGVGTSWTFTFAQAVAPLAGTFNITAQAVDSVGHTASQTTPFQVDAAAPVIALIATNATRYSAVSGHNQVVLTFNVYKNDQSAPLTSLSVTHNGTCLPSLGACPAFQCSAFQAAFPNYTCTYTVTGKEALFNGTPINTLSEATLPITIYGADAVGNQLTGSTSMTLDLRGPDLAGAATLSYLLGMGNVLSSIGGVPVTAARFGTDVRLAFTTTEPILNGSGTPSISSSPAGLNFTETSGSSSSFIFDATIPATSPPSDGTYSLQLVATDLVGNTTTFRALSLPQPVVDNTPPAPPNTVAGGPITYVRIPWGSSATFGSPIFEVTGSSGAISDPATKAVIVYDQLEDLLGAGQVSGTGFGTIVLSQADRTAVYVAGVDGAGNISAATPVHNVSWTAGFGAKATGNTLSNPFVVTTASDFLVSGAASPYLGPLAQPTSEASEPTSAGYFALLLQDTSVLTTAIDPSIWQSRVTVTTTLPAVRWGHGLVYDSTRGRLVLFGGQSASSQPLGDTWEWDGLQWINATPPSSASPPARITPAMAFDPVRGRTVLFGGSGSGGGSLGDTWEWDGTTWTNVTPTSGPSPSARTAAAMAYDATHGVMVMAGGTTNDTWTWNGSAWTNVTPTSNSLPIRRFQAMAYDAASGAVLFFGGNDPFAGTFNNDLWAWSGSTWTLQSPGGTAPAQRKSPAMAYDAARQRVVLFGGETTTADLNDTWELTWSSGSYAWVNVVPTGSATSPSIRESVGLAYDSAHGQTVLVAGWKTYGGATYYNDSWSWNGTAWTSLTPSAVLPGVRNYVGMTYDSGRARTVLFGGNGSSSTFNDTWEWNGFAWTNRAPATSPSARYLHALAYDSNTAHQYSVLFGGTTGSALLNDTWTWNGTTWTQMAPTTSPPVRMGHAMAYDATHGSTVLFGGCTAGAPYCSTVGNDTWVWNGTTWTNVTPSTSPPARAFAALSYDATRGRVVLFGGCASIGATNSCVSFLNDTWEWNGTSWTNVTPTGTSPGARDRHVLAYDRARSRTVLFAGENSGGALSDVWEWDGSAWVSISAASGNARFSHAMVYDISRGRLVAFGGISSGAALANDTLESPTDPQRRAAEIAEFPFAAVGETAPVIQQISVSSVVSGVGNTLNLSSSGVAQPGATLAVWNASLGGWVQLATNTSSTPGALNYTTQSAAEAAGFLSGTPQSINVAVFPTLGRGNGPGATQVKVDLLELTVQYQR